MGRAPQGPKLPRAGRRALRDKVEFQVSPRYETFYALEAITSDETRIHREWLRAARASLPVRVREDLEALAAPPALWPALADLAGAVPPAPDLGPTLRALASLDGRNARAQILESVVHDARSVRSLLAPGADVRRELSRIPAAKRDWATFMGLYPPQPGPMLAFVERVVIAPDEILALVRRIVAGFWSGVFQETWVRLRPQYEASRDEKERLFAALDFGEFAKAALLRVEVEAGEGGHLRALRGGYAVKKAELDRVVLLPSAFNDRRLWTTHAGAAGVVAELPYFEPQITLRGRPGETVAQAAIDPALVVRALGDPTRYAIALLLARRPMHAAALAEELGLTRPTMSHHVSLLREAGLLREETAGKAVLLDLRREAIESLSAALVENLFESPTPRKEKP